MDIQLGDVNTYNTLNSIVTSTCIGFVVYTNHDNEGKSSVEIILNKDGKYDFTDNKRHIFNSVEKANAFAKKHQEKYTAGLLVRPYFSSKYQKK